MNALLTALFALPLAIAPPPPTSPPPTVAISAGSAIAIDAATGAVLFQKNADEQRPVASLTKMMTAIVAQDGGLLGADIRISADAASTPGSSAGLRTGEVLRGQNLLRALLVSSANDAAQALAQHAGYAGFIAQMNQTAAQFGMANTRFQNPHGLDAADAYSTARDMATLTRALLRRADLAQMLALGSAQLQDNDGRLLIATNRMLGSWGNVGGKTGTTAAAGECFAGLFRWGNRQIVVVVLGSQDRFADAKSLAFALGIDADERPAELR